MLTGSIDLHHQRPPRALRSEHGPGRTLPQPLTSATPMLPAPSRPGTSFIDSCVIIHIRRTSGVYHKQEMLAVKVANRLNEAESFFEFLNYGEGGPFKLQRRFHEARLRRCVSIMHHPCPAGFPSSTRSARLSIIHLKTHERLWQDSPRRSHVAQLLDGDL